MPDVKVKKDEGNIQLKAVIKISLQCQICMSCYSCSVISFNTGAITGVSPGMDKNCCGNSGVGFPASQSLIFHLQITFKLSV